MKRVLALLCCAWLAAAGVAGVAQAQQGYAFDQPEILVAQRLWGIAHGARLLAQACAQAGQGDAAEAWVAWHEREMPQILAAGRLLASHYFGEETAPPDALTAVLGLKPVLALPPEQLAPACASLAEALAKPRYDLAKRRDELLVQQREELLKSEPKP